MIMKNLLKYQLLLPLVLLLGLAPFYPQPHIVKKLKMLSAGNLKRPIDLFDLFWHAWPFALLVCRISLDFRRKTR